MNGGKMKLRKLELKDAPLMLEWMHDISVVRDLSTDFSSKTLKDAEKFIESSQSNTVDLNLALVSNDDEYMGTVSLKNINIISAFAEFAITVRKTAMGQGYSWYAMKTILQKGLSELALDCIYWCVSKNNVRAIKFYDKHNFQETTFVPEEIKSRYKDVDNLKWYFARKGFDFCNQRLINGCKIINIKTISTDACGMLSFIESERDVPFYIKRIYYISGVAESVKRGFHAHKKLKQLIFCPYGHIKLILEGIDGKCEIELCNPSIGVLVEKPIWREMVWQKSESVLCVVASEFYDPEDYIRDYDDFKKFILE